jgi:hypothetical protein
MPQVKVFTTQELNNYFKAEFRWYFYKSCCDKHEDFLPHSDGKKPLNIIQRQRPNEPDEVMEFRLAIWEPITQPIFTAVVSSLSKIRRSSDWSIIYPKEQFSKIREGFELEEYCEAKFPYFTSVTNWVFSVWLKQYLIDSNGVALVMPLNTEEVEETDYLEPFPQIYNSSDVIDYKENEYAVLNIPKGCTYGDEHNNIKMGRSLYIVTAETIQQWDQIDDKNNFTLAYEYKHNLGFMPAFKNGGVVCNSMQNYFVYESRIKGMLPNLNEAIAEYTDLQAGKRLNIYPERWEYTQHECPKCRGVGVVANPLWKVGDNAANRQVKCGACINGYIPSGPFSKMLLRPQEIGLQAIPTPPAGFIEKDIEIIKVMSESVDAHIYKALSAINFQFLAQTPLNQSGTAKEVDKEELNNTVHAIAEDIVAFMDKIYATIAAYRYNRLYSVEEISAMLPTIPVPQHFDLISSQYMQEEIKRSRDAKINPLIISQMEVEFSAKRFAQDTEMNNIVRLIHNLNPLPAATPEEKMVMKSNGTITREDNIISDNIIAYIRRAMFENPNFDKLELDKQKEVLKSYAEEQITASDEAARMAAQVAAEDQAAIDAAAAGEEADEEEAILEEQV